MGEDIELMMPKPAGMKSMRALKAEGYADYLYRHGVLTLAQLEGLTRTDDMETIGRILRDSRYGKPYQHNTVLYQDGAWRRKNRMNCWMLTTDGERLVEQYLYPGVEQWGYSSGRIVRKLRQNTNRILLMNEMVVKVSEYDTDAWWVNVAYWLNGKGARTNPDLSKLWHERPNMMGVLEMKNMDIGVGLYSSGLQGLTMNLKRIFPKELDLLNSQFMPVLFLTQDVYERFLPALIKVRMERNDLVVLPYEYCLDHPDKLVHVLNGQREAVFQPLFARLSHDGWIVEKSDVGEPYTWRVRKNGIVEFIDGTFGTQLAHRYEIVLGDTGRTGPMQSGNRVLYVTSEREAQDVRAAIKRRYKGQLKEPPELRVMDW